MSYFEETWTAASMTLGFMVFLPNLTGTLGKEGVLEGELQLDEEDGVDDLSLVVTEAGELKVFNVMGEVNTLSLSSVAFLPDKSGRL